MVRALAWRSVTARKGRAVLNGAGIVLGVALIFAVLSLSKTIVSTFDELFGAVYGNTDLIVAGSDSVGTVDESALALVKRTDGIKTATTSVGSTATLVRDGEASSSQKDQVFVSGIVPSEPDLSGSKTVDGRDPESGNEISLDESWAEANNIQPGEKIELAAATGINSFEVVGLFRLGKGVEFGGQGFAVIPQERAREIFDVKSGFNEIDIELEAGADTELVKKALVAQLPEGIEAKTPTDVSDDINSQIQGFNIILYFFAAMSLFVGAFLILNSFNMTVAQRLREIGMLRTLGASRSFITKMFLIEALFLGIIGSMFGIVLGLLLSKAMIALVGSIGFPIGAVKYPPIAFIIAPLCGILATVFGALRPATRAGRIPPIQAVLTEHRAEPLNLSRRLLVGGVLIFLGLAGVFTLASSSSTPLPIVLAGAFGVIFLFSGVIMIGPVIVPWLVRVLSWPLRKLTPIEGRLAADSAKANPVRTASTASGLMIGIALVAAIGTLGSSFIGSISDDLDKELKNDFTVQPKNFFGGGPQATISTDSVAQIAALPGAKTATGVRMLWLTNGYGSGSQAIGIDPLTHSEFASAEYVAGTQAEVDQKLADGQITVPEGLAKGKKTKVGDSITLDGPRGSKRLKVAALQKGNSSEASAIVMSNETFLALYGVEGYTQVLAVAKSPDQRGALQNQITALVADKYPTFEVLSNEEVKAQIKDQINQVFSIFYVIMLVAIIVSLLGVVNTLLMNVLERTREIGVLRAIGSARWQVRRLIIAESLLLTLAGAILGLIVGMALGYAFVRGISASGQAASFHPPVGVIVLVAVLSVLFGVLAALLPARRAARMNVIEAVSYE